MGVDSTLFFKGSIADDKKCVYKCVQEIGFIISSSGDFTIDQFVTKHPNTSPEGAKALKACADTSKKDDPCDSAKAFHVCITKT